MKRIAATTLLILSLGLVACAGSQGHADNTGATPAKGIASGDQGNFGYKTADEPYQGIDLHWNR